MHDLFVEIGESLRRNKLRSALAGFSVAWGIFMIIVLLGAGNGLVNAFNQGRSNILANTMEVYGGYTTMPYDGLQSGRPIKLDSKDMVITSSFSENVDQVSASLRVGGLGANYKGNFYREKITLRAVYPGYFTMNKIKVISGRVINDIDIDEQCKNVLISSNQARHLTHCETNWKRLVGERIQVGDYYYTVVGIYESRDNSMWEDMYVPFTTLKTLYGKGEKIEQLTFSFHGLETQEENEEFEKSYRAAVNLAHRANPVDNGAIYLWNRFTQNMQMEKVTRILNVSLWLLGFLTLLGGLVSVSNIMLIAVRERKHEFGIRKAIGASPWQIVRLILAESVTITAVFGYIGMFLGMVACEVLDSTVGQTSMEVFGESMRLLVNPTVGLDVAVKATLLLVVSGSIAGLIPALKAARVRPVEALKEQK